MAMAARITTSGIDSMPSNSRLMLACYCLRHLIPLRHSEPSAKVYIAAWLSEIRRIRAALPEGN